MTTLRKDRRALPLRLRDRIRDLIQSEGFDAGTQLPSEAEFASRFGVARTTVREALKLLEQDGLIDVRHGKGRYVSPIAGVERPVTRLESVTEMLHGLGYEVRNRVLSVRRLAATDEESAALGLDPGAEVIRLERLRFRDDELLIYSVDVLPAATVGEVDPAAWEGSLLGLLEERGFRITSAVARISATALPPAAAAAVPGAKRYPWLLLRHVNRDDRGRPVIVSEDYHRGDLFSLHVLRRREPGG